MQYEDVCCDASVHASMLYSLVLAPRMLWMNPIKGYSETEKALEYTQVYLDSMSLEGRASSYARAVAIM